MSTTLFTAPDGRRFVRVERPDDPHIPWCADCRHKHYPSERHKGSPSDWRPGWHTRHLHPADRTLAAELGLLEETTS